MVSDVAMLRQFSCELIIALFGIICDNLGMGGGGVT